MPRRPCDDDIRRALFVLLDERADGATVCPSEVARRLSADANGWRDLMPAVRAVAARLASQGALRVTRRGVEVDALDDLGKGGPIRLGRPPAGDAT